MCPVTSGYKASFKSKGNLNEAGNYGFLVTTIDGKYITTGQHKLRIIIWDITSNTTNYYNQYVAGEEVLGVTSIRAVSFMISNPTAKKSDQITNPVDLNDVVIVQIKTFSNPYKSQSIIKFALDKDEEYILASLLLERCPGIMSAIRLI